MNEMSNMSNKIKLNKIVYMITTLFYPSIGGVENHVYNLGKELVSLGYKVKIINPVINLGRNEIYNLDGIQVHRITVGSINDEQRYLFYKQRSRDNLIGYLNGYMRKLFYNKYSNYLYEYIIKDINHEKSNEVIIHQHDFISSIKLSRKLSKRYNVFFTNHTGEFLFLKKLPLSKFIIKLLTYHFKFIIAPSEELAEFANIRDKDTHMYLPNGVDTKRFCRTSDETIKKLKEEYIIPNNKKIVFCPRRWAPTKGIIYLVKAIDILVNRYGRKDIIFVFAGNDYNDYPEYKNEIERIIEDKSLHKYIIFKGNVNYDSMDKLIKVSDIVVIPSLMEAVSLAALESMACGKIVIGTRVGGFTQIIDDKINGFLIPPKDEECLSALLNDVTSNLSEYSIIGERANEFVNNGYSWGNIAKKTNEIYESFANIKNCI